MIHLARASDMPKAVPSFISDDGYAGSSSSTSASECVKASPRYLVTPPPTQFDACVTRNGVSRRQYFRRERCGSAAVMIYRRRGGYCAISPTQYFCCRRHGLLFSAVNVRYPTYLPLSFFKCNIIFKQYRRHAVFGFAGGAGFGSRNIVPTAWLAHTAGIR